MFFQPLSFLVINQPFSLVTSAFQCCTFCPLTFLHCSGCSPPHIDGRVHLVQLRSLLVPEKAIQAIAFLQVITHHYDGDVPAIAAESIVAGFICPSTKNTGCCAIFSYKSAQTGEQAGDTAQGIVLILPPVEQVRASRRPVLVLRRMPVV